MSRIHWFRAVFAALVLSLSSFGFAVEAQQATTEVVMQIDINSADAESLAAALDGVGLVRAREIVAYREMFGQFRSVDELLEVEGIGPATLERNRHKIVVISD
ncbi:MAG: ComEA family DNA-binding protein [Gammaproteobacteria bacterium]